MKKLNTSFAAICLAAITLIGCQKEVKEPAQNTISEQTLAQIKNAGFAIEGAKKVDGGYLVEGDILLTDDNLNSRPSSPNLVIAQEEQYHTFNLVERFPRTITVALSLDAASSGHSTVFNKALDETISRYNAETLGLTFQKVTSGANITIVGYNENSSTLGSAGFPTESGEPYHQIKMNTYHYDTDANSTTNVNYIATIMAHEVGHCIGFRHTDYMNRKFSCGFSFPNNEGQTTTGVGAVHIPGTPTKADRGSWMLACIGDGVNRPFNTNDQTALDYLY